MAHYISKYDTLNELKEAILNGDLASPYVAFAEDTNQLYYDGDVNPYECDLMKMSRGTGITWNGRIQDMSGQMSGTLQLGVFAPHLDFAVYMNGVEITSGTGSDAYIAVNIPLSANTSDSAITYEFVAMGYRENVGWVATSETITLIQDANPNVAVATLETTNNDELRNVLNLDTYSANGIVGLYIDGDSISQSQLTPNGLCYGYTFANFGSHTIKYVYGSNVAGLATRYTDIETFSASTAITAIDANAMRSCTTLANVYAPGVEAIYSSHSIRDCVSLTSVTLSSSVTYIGKKAFWGDGLLTNINSGVFTATTYVGDNSFRGTAITGLTFGYALQDLEYAAFQDCGNLQSIVFDNNCNVGTVGSGLFAGCTALTEVTFPTSVITHTSSVQYPTFKNCSSLTAVTFGDYTTTIGAGMFSVGCTSLVSITCKSETAPSLGGNDFDSITANTGTLHIPYGCTSAYASWASALGANWTIEEGQPPLIPTVCAITEYYPETQMTLAVPTGAGFDKVYKYDEDISDYVEISMSEVSGGTYTAEAGQLNLMYVRMGNDPYLQGTWLGNSDMEYCSVIGNVPFGLHSNDYYGETVSRVFSGDTKLQIVNFGENCVRIGSDNFIGCTALTEMYFEGTTAPSFTGTAAIPFTTISGNTGIVGTQGVDPSEFAQIMSNLGPNWTIM